MIFPELGPQYYDEKDKAILSKMEAFYSESITINQSFWGEADTDLRFYANDQTLWTDIFGSLPSNRRTQFTFNRIARTINMISGYQRRNRKSTTAIPVENGNDETADQYTKILSWLDRQEGIGETISDSFLGSLITGMNLLQVWMDFRSDPVSGNIRVDNCPYNTFIIDPYFKKQDLSDCNGIWKRTYLTKRQVVSLMPDKADIILGLYGNDTGSGRDGKFQFQPESYTYAYSHLLTYDEYYYRDFRTQLMLVDTQTGETTEWQSSNREKLKLFLKQYPSITVIENEIPTVKLAIVVQGKVLYHGANPNGSDLYPFIPVFAYYHPEIPYLPWKIQGVVRGLRDSQYLYNRRKIIELDILESQVNSGFKYKENALVNPKDIFLSGQGRGIALKEEAAMTDVEQIIAPAIPASMIELSKLLGDEINQISGVNEELLGSAVDDKAGVLSMLRQGAGLTTLQLLFDNLDRSQKLLGNLMLDLIRTNFTPGKIQKILNGEQPSDHFYSKEFGKYGCAIEEGLNTTTQKQMMFAQLLQMRQIGIPITDKDLLDASTFQGKKQIIENMQAAQQQSQQLQQQQAQVQMAEIQARTELAQARAQSDRGLGAERISRIEENRAMAIEKLHEANKNDEQALLEKVKVLKELEDMDIGHIERLINMANKLKSGEKEASIAENRNFAPAENVSPSGIRG